MVGRGVGDVRVRDWGVESSGKVKNTMNRLSNMFSVFMSYYMLPINIYLYAYYSNLIKKNK